MIDMFWRYWIFFILLSSTLHASSWDLEYWQFLKWTQWKKDPFQIYASAETRLNKVINPFYFYRLTQAFAVKANSYLDLETHISYIWEKSRGNKHFTNRARLELEVNPHYTFSNDVQLKWRNRLEIIKRQNMPKLEYVFRHRILLNVPLKNMGKLKFIRTSTEIFYNLSTHYFTQNRFRVIELGFAPSSKTVLNVFIMVRNFFSALKWYRSIVLGSEWEF